MFDRRFHDNIYHDAQALISSTKANLRSSRIGCSPAVAVIGISLNHFFLQQIQLSCN